MRLPVLRHHTHRYSNYAQELRVSQVLLLAIALFLITGLSPVLAVETAWDAAVEAVLQDDHSGAISRLQEFLRQASPNDERRVRAVRWLSMMHQNNGDREQAKQSLATNRNDTSLSATDRGVLTIDLANLYSESGNLSRARELYGEAIALDPTLLAAYLNRANVQVREERREQAIRDYERYLSLNPQTPQASAVQEMIRVLRQAITAEQAAQEMRQQAEQIAEEERREREAEEAQRRRADEEAEQIAAEAQAQEEEAQRRAEVEAEQIAAEAQAQEEAEQREAQRTAAEAQAQEEAAQREEQRTAAEAQAQEEAEQRRAEVEAEQIASEAQAQEEAAQREEQRTASEAQAQEEAAQRQEQRTASEAQAQEEAAQRQEQRTAAEAREREEAAQREAEQAASEERTRAAALARVEAERAREEMLQSVMESLGGARRESRAFGLDAEDIRIDEDQIDVR